MKRFCVFIIAAFCLASCSWFEPDIKDRHVLFIYIAGNNSLSSYGQNDLYDIEQSWLPSERDKDQAVMVFYHFLDGVPTLSRFYKSQEGVTVEEVIKTYPTSTNSADPETLKIALDDAEEAWPAARHSLILWSHGSGFLPEGYYANPKDRIGGRAAADEVIVDPYAGLVKSDDSKSFAEDHGTEMDIRDLAEALSSRHYEFVLFDACLMANVEVAYELRKCCDYLLFSPTEILADGFPYEMMVQPVFTLDARDALVKIAQSYMAHYRALSGEDCSAAVTVVRTDRIEVLADACKPIFQNHQDAILTLDRSKVQPYFRLDKHWYYDLEDFLSQVATKEELELIEFYKNAGGNWVVFKDATEEFLGIELKKVSGLSIYIPRSEYTVLNNYYKTLAWNKATGLVR